MKLKAIFLSIAGAFVPCMILNGLFHIKLAGEYFDRSFRRFGETIYPMAKSDPGRIAVVELIWISALFYLLTLNRQDKLDWKTAAIGGMWMNAATSGTWNLVNGSLFSVFPSQIILPDMAWHILVIGPVAGICLAFIFNHFGASKQVTA